MIKFLVKTAVTVGIVGLALEGVKKVLENCDEKQNANHDEHCEDEFITITPSLPVETETNTPVEPEEPVDNVEPEDNANPVQKEEPFEQAVVTEEESKEEGSNPTEESTDNQSVAE